MSHHNVRYLQQDGDSATLESHLLEVQQKRRGKRETNPTVQINTPVELVLLTPDGKGLTVLSLTSGYRVITRSAREVGVVGESEDETVWLTFDCGRGHPRMTNIRRTPKENPVRGSAMRRGTLTGRVPRRAAHA